MDKFDSMQRHGDSGRSPPRQSIEQLLRVEGEDDHGAHAHKKSVLKKVKETAKKLKHTLSHKKRHDDDDVFMSARKMEDDEDFDNREYVGAPMYESALSEKHVSISPNKHGVDKLSSPKTRTEALLEKLTPTTHTTYSDGTTLNINGNTGLTQPTPPTKQTNQKKPGPTRTLKAVVTEKLAPALSTMSDAKSTITSKIQGLGAGSGSGSGSASQPVSTGIDKHYYVAETNKRVEKSDSPNKAITGNLAEKMSPSYTAMIDGRQPNSPKIDGSTRGSTAEPTANSDSTEMGSAAITSKNDSLDDKCNSPNKTITESVTEKLAPAYATVSDVTHSITSKIQGLTVSSQTDTETNNDSDNNTSARETNETSTVEHKWDKGVSMKEYIMQKLEPGEDDKALSEVISHAISPRKNSGDPGMVERMKGAVTSLLWEEESKNPIVPHVKSNSIASIPVSNNTREVEEENHHERILQAN